MPQWNYMGGSHCKVHKIVQYRRIPPPIYWLFEGDISIGTLRYIFLFFFLHMNFEILSATNDIASFYGQVLIVEIIKQTTR